MLLIAFSLLSLNLLASAQECGFSETCVPIKSCEPIVEQLKIAKNTIDSEKKRDIIATIRSKICGEQEKKLICCSQDAAHLPVEQLQQQQQPQEQAYLGEFVNIFHDIAGEVYALSDSQLLIKGFNYDGEGPDAFFLAGLNGNKPNSKTTDADIVLPYPATGKQYGYQDKDIPILGQFIGSEDIVLTLPPGQSTSNLRWLSVWCRDYKVNFGHATF